MGVFSQKELQVNTCFLAVGKLVGILLIIFDVTNLSDDILLRKANFNEGIKHSFSKEWFISPLLYLQSTKYDLFHVFIARILLS